MERERITEIEKKVWKYCGIILEVKDGSSDEKGINKIYQLNQIRQTLASEIC